MLFPLILLFTVVPIIELSLLIKAGSMIGVMNTIGIVFVTGVVGAFLAKSQGKSILMKLQSELSRGEIPGETLIHGFLVFAGGLLLLTPGFVTDIFGLSMVLPFTRFLFVKTAKKYFENKIKSGQFKVVTYGQDGFGGGFYSSSQQNPEEFFKNIQNQTERDVTPTEAKVIDIHRKKSDD